MSTMEKRLKAARAAINAFNEAKPTDAEDQIADLLADLMHLCEQRHQRGDFADHLRRGLRNYRAETRFPTFADEIKTAAAEA